MTCAAARPRWRSTSKSPGSASLAVAIDKRAFLAGSGPRHAPCPSAGPGEPGEGCGRGWPGCEPAGRAATCVRRAALPPCRPRSVGRGGSAPSAPRSTRDVGTEAADLRERSSPTETGPGLREGLQPRVERGRPWPARPTLRTRIALGRSTAIARRDACAAPAALLAPKRAEKRRGALEAPAELDDDQN